MTWTLTVSFEDNGIPQFNRDQIDKELKRSLEGGLLLKITEFNLCEVVKSLEDKKEENNESRD